MPKVSVIIPTYNRARYLAEAVESVLAQTFRDFEVVIVDDGSTDNTRDIAAKFPAAVRYYHQENEGASSARNAGIERAGGEYLVFLDSDDALLEDALEAGVAFLDRHPGVGFCYGQLYSMDEDGRLLMTRRLRGAKRSCVRTGKEQVERILFRGDITPAAALVRRSCLEEVGGFDTAIPTGQDIDMWLRLSRRFDVGYLARPLAKYRVHDNSITGQKTFRTLELSQTEFVERALAGLESVPYYRSLRKKAYFGLYCYLAGKAARDGFRVTGLRYALKAVRLYPGMLMKGEGLSFLGSVAAGFCPARLRQSTRRLLLSLKLR